MTEFRTDQLETAVVQTITAWATANPIDLVTFDRQMKQHRELEANSKELRHYGEIPAGLNYRMHTRFGKDWAFDARIRTLFWSHFKVGKLDRAASPMFQPSGARSEM